MKLHIYNTATKSTKLFTPLDEKNVRMYVCGPTVYDYAHIGNARSVVVFDVLFRLLQEIYGQNNVRYVRNITDIDDKINARAKELKITIKELTEKTNQDFQDDMDYLKCKKPTMQPKATEHVKEMCDIIQKLIDNNAAYIAENKTVYFHVPKADNYGLISSVQKEAQEEGYRIEVEKLKKDPRDFVLWKPRDEEDDASSVFESPFGEGRPGWHIECSAMAGTHLGETFDIHGGGIDLAFPHHTNEIAQSTCAYKGSKYAIYWMHNGFLTVNGDKMSKSLKNFITVRDLVNQNIKGEVLRLFLMRYDYKKPLDYTEKGLYESRLFLDFLYRAIAKGAQNQDIDNDAYLKIKAEFFEPLLDDLNVYGALDYLYNLAKKINISHDKKEVALYSYAITTLGNFLGILQENPSDWFCDSSSIDISTQEIDALISERKEAKLNKNYKRADGIRNYLESKNIVLEDLKDVTTWRVK